MRSRDWSSDVCSSDLDDETDLYWARSRVLEYLSQARDQLPGDVPPVLRPDATGLGWIYQYALVDRSGRHHLGELRAFPDWFLRFAPHPIPDVAHVTHAGGPVQHCPPLQDPPAP